MERPASTSPDERRPAHSGEPRRVVTVDDEALAARYARGYVALVDDDADVLSALAARLSFEGYAVQTFASALHYLEALDLAEPSFPGPRCLLCDLRMPEIDGLALQRLLKGRDVPPMVLMSGQSLPQDVVSAFHEGAVDFLIKPFDASELQGAIAKALRASEAQRSAAQRQLAAAALVSSLTDKELKVIRLVVQGQTNPQIMVSLDIALRTVKLHRQRAMEKLGLDSVAALGRFAQEVGW
jgi:FixJ family two-component response regulator